MFRQQDPPLKADIKECFDDIRTWRHYDNWQHNEYRDENRSGYGPIRFFNARFEIVSECLNPTEMDEKYKIVWNEYPSWHIYHFCDLSERRMQYLKDISTRKEIKYIKINDEREKLMIYIKKGAEILPVENFCELSKENNCRNLHSKNNDCTGCIRWTEKKCTCQKAWDLSDANTFNIQLYQSALKSSKRCPRHKNGLRCIDFNMLHKEAERLNDLPDTEGV